jgi:hypothetical protein
MRIPLHKRIFLNFVLIIALFGILGAVLSAVLINRTTLDEAQRRVSLDLRSAWDVLHNEMDRRTFRSAQHGKARGRCMPGPIPINRVARK